MHLNMKGGRCCCKSRERSFTSYKIGRGLFLLFYDFSHNGYHKFGIAEDFFKVERRSTHSIVSIMDSNCTTLPPESNF